MTTQELRMMMLDIDGILTRYEATTTDAIAEQIRTALHKRIDEGKLPEW